MQWNPFDFQGIGGHGTELVQQLSDYLKDQEQLLSRELALACPNRSSQASPYALSQAADLFCKGLTAASPFYPEDWKRMVAQINSAFWEYLEGVDGCMGDLFLQLEQMGYEQWSPEFKNRFEQIEALLMRSLSEALEALQRVEERLKQARGRIWLLCWRCELDSALFSVLKRNRAELYSRSQQFAVQYGQWVIIQEKLDRCADKLSHFPVFKASTWQTDYLFVYQYLKFWEFSLKEKILSKELVARSLRHSLDFGTAFHLFSTYLEAAKQALFLKSRQLKEGSATAIDMRVYLDRLHQEVVSLTVTTGKFRDHLLKTDPDPYIRSRWGFPEWIVGPEPEQTKKVLDLVYEGEKIDHWIAKFCCGLRDEKRAESAVHIEEAVRETLHLMGQPLITRSSMQAKAQRVLELLEELDELASHSSAVVDFIGNALLQVIHIDRKFGLLSEISTFSRVFEVHLGILGPQANQYLEAVEKELNA